ncbi:Poly(A) polymerase I precursor, partial [Haemophilus influenzae]
ITMLMLWRAMKC